MGLAVSGAAILQPLDNVGHGRVQLGDVGMVEELV
jgi:hypothetical protein